MPSKTNEDKIDDLTRLVSGHVEQFRALEGQLSGIVAEKGELASKVTEFSKSLAVFEQQVKDLRGWKESFGTIDQLKVDMALKSREIDELKKWQEEVKKKKDEWGQRVWVLVTTIVTSIISTAVGWALGYFSRPK